MTSTDEVDALEAAVERASASVSPETRAKIYKAFIETDDDFVSLAISYQLPVKVIQLWARQGKWMERKKQLELELMDAADSSFRKFQLENRMPTVKRHLAAAKRIEEIVMEKLPAEGEDIASQELRRLTETLGMASNISNRAVGADKMASQKEDAGGKINLFLVNPPTPKVPEIRVQGTSRRLPPEAK